jgi:hypothetical protein
MSEGNVSRLATAIEAARVAAERVCELEAQLADERERRNGHIRAAVDFGAKPKALGEAIGLTEPSIYRILGSP